jgi:hypothetical protein
VPQIVEIGIGDRSTVKNQTHLALLICTVEPAESLIRLAAQRVHLGDEGSRGSSVRALANSACAAGQSNSKK